MAIEVKKYVTPIMNNGEPCTFPTFADQVIKEDGTPLEYNGKINISPDEIGAVSSVNGESGDVMLTADEVGASEITHTHAGMYTTSNLIFSLSGTTLTITTK